MSLRTISFCVNTTEKHAFLCMKSIEFCDIDSIFLYLQTQPEFIKAYLQEQSDRDAASKEKEAEAAAKQVHLFAECLQACDLSSQAGC
jgi:shikimate kinase